MYVKLLILNTKFGFICGKWNLYYNIVKFQNSLSRIVNTALCYGKLNFVCSSRAFCKMYNFKERFQIKQSAFSNWEHNKKRWNFSSKIYLSNVNIYADICGLQIFTENFSNGAICKFHYTCSRSYTCKWAFMRNLVRDLLHNTDLFQSETVKWYYSF